MGEMALDNTNNIYNYESYTRVINSFAELGLKCCNDLDVKYKDTFEWFNNALENIKTQYENDSRSSIRSKRIRKKNAVPTIKEEDEHNEKSSSSRETSSGSKRQHSSDSLSESTDDQSVVQQTGRAKRTASIKAQAVISEQVNLKISKKLRRPSNWNMELSIKQEKINTNENAENIRPPNIKNDSGNNVVNNNRHINVLGQSEIINSNVVSKIDKRIKKEKIDEYLMPPPRDTRTKTLAKKERTSKRKVNSKKSTLSDTVSDDDSDIIEIKSLQSHKISVIDLDSSAESEKIADINENDNSRQGKNEIVKDKLTSETIEKNETENEATKQIGQMEVIQNNNTNNDSPMTIMEKPTVKVCSVPLIKLNAVDLEQKLADEFVDKESNMLNVTVTVDKKCTLNETYCKIIDNNKSSPIITEDESDTDYKTPENKIPKVIKKNKTLKPPALFSPYRNDPVKKRVEAFEKLKKDTEKLTENKETVRITRTKTRALAAANEEKEKAYESESGENNKNTSALLKDKCTPLNNKQFPITAHFSNKPLARSTPLSSSAESLRSVSSTASIRKDLKKQKEDVKHKKEALLQAKIEEQRKKREEKAWKAQQAREQLEKERQLAMLQAERDKEEKQKQIQAEREEMLRKEAQRKRALAAQKAAETEERRKAEEAARKAKFQEQDEAERRAELKRKKDQEEAERLHQKRLAEEREAERLHQKRLAEEREAEAARAQVRLQMKAKLANAKLNKKVKGMPTPVATGPVSKIPEATAYSFDSGDSTDDEERPKRPIPEWSVRANRQRPLKIQSYIPKKCVDMFFSCQPTVINLREVFDQIDSRLLRRNSSAVWRTPPRYSQMPRY